MEVIKFGIAYNSCFYVSPNRKNYRQGPPDQLWINSLRNGISTSPGKQGYSPDRPKVNTNIKMFCFVRVRGQVWLITSVVDYCKFHRIPALG